MSDNAFEKKVTPQEAKRLAREGHFSEEALEHVLSILDEVPSRQRWASFIQKLFLGLGWIMIVTGIFFFFAFNWDNLPKIVQFGVVEVLIVGAFVAALVKGIDSSAGRVALIFGNCMVGLFLLLFAQTYQTNVDEYLIFLIWMALVGGWVVASRFYLHVLLYAVLANFTLFLYLDQIITTYSDRWVSSLLGLLVLNGIILLLWEVGLRKGWPWALKGWAVRIIFFAVMTIGTLPAIVFISGTSNQSPFFWIQFVLFLVILTGAILYYRFKKLDKFMLAIAFLSILALVISLLINVLGTEWWDFLIVGVAVVVLSTLAARWLRGISSFSEVAS